MSNNVSGVSSRSLQIHFSLKARGSNFSDIARRASKRGREISPYNVRLVVYGVMRKNAEPIWNAINAVLEGPSLDERARQCSANVERLQASVNGHSPRDKHEPEQMLEGSP